MEHCVRVTFKKEESASRCLAGGAVLIGPSDVAIPEKQKPIYKGAIRENKNCTFDNQKSRLSINDQVGKGDDAPGAEQKISRGKRVLASLNTINIDQGSEPSVVPEVSKDFKFRQDHPSLVSPVIAKYGRDKICHAKELKVDWMGLGFKLQRPLVYRVLFQHNGDRFSNINASYRVNK